MFDHVTIRVSDRAASERFYDTVLGAIGIERTATSELGPEWDDFSLAAASAEKPVTRGLHIGFGAKSTGDVDAFWRAGVDAGYESDGEPGPRPIYGDDYYGGFLLDPDGNSVEAVHFEGSVTGAIDHLWIRVADVEASKRFYETIAPHARDPARHRHSRAGAVQRRAGLLLGAERRPRDGEPPHGVPGDARTRPSTTSTRPRSRPATATTASPASARSTTRATTERSC